ncbi:phosphonate ABC transporter, permease protein PhnE [Geovibrio thiophilus]|uniref:Phosphonate ABC transporter, permease protein PhnE n=1 Tax=Geovibrio thiophilus TaxID=139438 RepID=A0A410K0B5_9BACT|nr:phosphonate ABC transporter, permease protein PhnE [Geovibrio thiophilus]QAR33829.1 phosphonate ABC transporter, permease protein PhnE [Geovibrio thiophilus]
MPLIKKDGAVFWIPRDSKKQLVIWFGWFIGLMLVYLSWRSISANTLWVFAADAPEQLGLMLMRMFPPKIAYMNKLWKPLWDTLNIATLGTVLGIIFAVPVAFLAASNTTPSVRFVRPFAMLILVSSRSVNSLIWALLLVTIVGPGILAGIIAIALRSVGFVGKLLYEAIEEIDHAQLEAVTATGAASAQVFSYGVVPQIMPAFAGISLYRWDINIRESTILGYVGAGGIGLNLSSSLSVLAWSQVSVILLSVLVTVVASEWISAKIRKMLI